RAFEADGGGGEGAEAELVAAGADVHAVAARDGEDGRAEALGSVVRVRDDGEDAGDRPVADHALFAADLPSAGDLVRPRPDRKQVRSAVIRLGHAPGAVAAAREER